MRFGLAQRNSFVNAAASGFSIAASPGVDFPARRAAKPWSRPGSVHWPFPGAGIAARRSYEKILHVLSVRNELPLRVHTGSGGET
jgi:hypothetical protein